MEEYPKIETLLNRNKDTFKVIEGEWRLPEFEYLKECQWEFTEKIDGTNIRVMWNGQVLLWGGKTDNAQIPTFLLAKLQGLFPSTKFVSVFPGSVCLYGEGYGAKIQKGGGNYIPNGVDFILFDVKIGEWWLKREDVAEIGEKLEIRIVPTIGYGTLLQAIETVKNGYKSQWGEFQAEGMVVRPITELQTRSGHRIIGKIKTRDF